MLCCMYSMVPIAMAASATLATPPVPVTAHAPRFGGAPAGTGTFILHDDFGAPPDLAAGSAREKVSRRNNLAIHTVREHIHRRPADNHAVPRLAGIARLSVGRFARVFKQKVGMPPHRYVCLVRIRHALALLEHGATPLQAALASGFYDQSHLSRSVKAISAALQIRRPITQHAFDLLQRPIFPALDEPGVLVGNLAIPLPLTEHCS